MTDYSLCCAAREIVPASCITLVKGGRGLYLSKRERPALTAMHANANLCEGFRYTNMWKKLA
jgi:hypothetical protein